MKCLPSLDPAHVRFGWKFRDTGWSAGYKLEHSSAMFMKNTTGLIVSVFNFSYCSNAVWVNWFVRKDAHMTLSSTALKIKWTKNQIPDHLYTSCLVTSVINSNFIYCLFICFIVLAFVAPFYLAHFRSSFSVYLSFVFVSRLSYIWFVFFTLEFCFCFLFYFVCGFILLVALFFYFYNFVYLMQYLLLFLA